MPIALRQALPVALFLAVLAPAAHATDVGEVARRVNLPVPVVDMVLHNVDAFFASADAPDNRMTSGLIKELTLKALKSHISHLADGGPGRVSESSSDMDNASYKVAFRTTRHDATESAECVETAAQITSQEGVPTIKDGDFTFDNVHPRVSNFGWRMTFCRTPLNGGTDFSEWQLK